MRAIRIRLARRSTHLDQLPNPRATRGPAVEALESRILLFSTVNHELLDSQNLGFLTDTIVADLKSASYWQDHSNGGAASAHFDACYFTESAAAMNAHYQNALNNADPAHFNSDTLASEFGDALHTAQDLYAHANWADTGITDLLDSSSGLWDSLTPYSIHSGAMLVEGEALPNLPGYGQVSLSRVGTRVTVSFPGGVTFPGIITGNYGSSDHSPDVIEMTHDQLNKDSSGTYFPAAYALGVRQTQHEFQRLGALIQGRYGDAGIAKLLQVWVKPDGASQNQARLLLGLPLIVVPPSDDTLASANDLGSLSAARTFNDFVGSSDTQDYYKLSFSDSALFTASLTGLSADADMQLLDGTGTLLVKSSNYNTANESISKTLASGTYYVRVYQYSGDTSYQLSLTGTAVPPRYDTLATARSLGTLSGAQSFSGSVNSSDTQDYYKFSLLTSTPFSAKLTGLSGDADLQLLDSAGTMLVKSSNYNTADELISKTLAAGTYYVRVYRYSADTGYQLTLQGGAPASTHDTLAAAQDLGSLSTTQTLSGAVSGADTQDYYKFTLAADAQFTTRLSGLADDANLQLLDGAGQVLADSTNAGAAEEAINRPLSAGAYYLRVYRASGDTAYQLSLAAAPVGASSPSGDGNTLATAYDLGNFTAPVTLSGSISNTDTQDFYRLSLTATTLLNVQMTGLTADADLRLLDSQGTTLVKSSASGSANESLTRSLAAGVYYLRVYQFSGNTAYQLSLSIGTASSNTTMATATNLGTLTGTRQATGYVGSGHTDEYFKFNFTAKHKLTATLSGLTADADLELLDSTGHVLIKSNKRGTVNDLFSKDLNSGTYYLHVVRYSGDTSYNLSLTAT